MVELIKKYWDIISGIFAGIGLAVIADFELESVQLYCSVIILILVCIGLFRTLRQAISNKKARKHNIIDSMVDSQKSIKAVRLAETPTKDGERLGEFIIKFWEVKKTNMKKVKEFFDKFKGFMLTIALAILTVVEMCGGFINSLCGGALTVNGIEILPLVTLLCTTIVGVISNGYSKEQKGKIKALFSKSTTNELVKEEIKKTIKEKSAQATQFNKILTTQQHELDNLKGELVKLKNTHEAKKEMLGLPIPLATVEDVQLAANAVVDCQAKIAESERKVAETQKAIDNLNTQINALKSQL